jgi:hypothetical protein
MEVTETLHYWRFAAVTKVDDLMSLNETYQAIPTYFKTCHLNRTNLAPTTELLSLQSAAGE